MKILHVAPSIESAYGGPTQSLAGYTSASQMVGADVDIAAPLPTRREIDVLEEAGARRVETFKGYGRGSTAASPSLVRWVRANARNYDVVHVHGLFNFISTFAARAAIASGLPVIIRPFGTLSQYTFKHRRGLLKRLWFEALERPNIGRAAALHFTTTTEKNEAEWNKLDIGRRAHVVPPPFIPASSLVSRQTDPRIPVALFLGRLHPVKNLEALIDAWPAVLAAHPDALLRIAGHGSPQYTSELKRRAGKRGIQFMGFLTGVEKAMMLQQASILVLPSLHENFGIAVVEAIAEGLPVVISEHVQLRDFVASNEIGIVTNGSPDSLATAISGAFSDLELHQRVSEKGRRLVSQTYSPEVIGNRLTSMYLSALKYHRERPSAS
jgi:glycosyltransferase involved in cell wall biosynthesis